MLQKTEKIRITTKGQQLINLTREINRFVNISGVELGLLNICILHTSASLVIQENASKDVLTDLLNFYDKLVPMDATFYNHSLEGKDDMPAHIKSSLTNSSLTISIVDGMLKLGIWQGIFLFEHRIGNYDRFIFCHIIGEN